MKNKILFFICCLLYSPISQAEGEPPLAFWSANKGEKTIYILGTIHSGLSLEDYRCAPGIKSYITNSKLLFSEIAPPTDYPLSFKDRKTLSIGSESEKQLVMDKIPEQDRENVMKAFKSRKKLYDLLVIRALTPFKIKSKEPAIFQDLSLKSQKFLTSYGFQQFKYNSEELLKEIVYFLLLTASYDAYFEIGKFLDFDVISIAKKNAVPIRALDNKEMSSEDRIQDVMSKKPIEMVKISDIELLIDHYEQFKRNYRLAWEKDMQKGFELISNENNSVFDFKDPNSKNALLKDRNFIWMEKIRESLKEKGNNKIFVAGGAAHFIEADNVIDMLKEDGFDITRLYCSGESLQP